MNIKRPIAGICTAALLFPALASAQTADPQQQKPKQQKKSPGSKTGQATVVSLSDIEENKARYKGQQVRVTGEVARVLGPRMFTIDERAWIDLDGETLVTLPAPMAALVREDAIVTVTGTVRPVVKAELEREWGWLGNDPHLEVDLKDRLAIVAESIALDEGVDAALRLSFGSPEEVPAGTSGKAGTAAPLTDMAVLAKSDDEKMVGRSVNLSNAKVLATAPNGGFWIGSGNARLFVLPAESGKAQVKQGQSVSVKGVVLELPAGMKEKIGDKQNAKDEQIYVYANNITTG